jgi:glycosyltransferase involved in cell wall biosynthesis
MRIAYLGSRHPESNYSGVERVLSNMLPSLAARGHEITVFSSPASGEAPGRRNWNGIEVVGLRGIHGKHSETISRTAVSVAHALARRFDVLHFTHQGPAVFTPLAYMAGIPSVVSVAGLDWQRAKWNRAASMAILGAERLAARYASSIIVLSSAVQSYFRSKYNRETTYIPQGLQRTAPPAPSGELRRLGVEPGKYFLFAARLVPEKAAHDLVMAWNDIETDMTLVVAGGGRYDPKYVMNLHAMAKPGKVVFTGHVQGQLLAELYGNCYVFVLPSYVEGQSLALLEAIGYGKAILVSDIPENTEVVRQNGFVFPVGNVAALRDTLQKLVDRPSLVQAAQTAIQQDVGTYASWDDVALMHEEVYFSVARRRHGKLSSQAAGSPVVAMPEADRCAD